MNEIRVKGFQEISFWREDSIGIIVIKTDTHGIMSLRALEETLTPLTTAVTDKEVTSVVITGQNNHFCNGIAVGESQTQQFLNSCIALTNLIHSLGKPVVCILNGSAKDFGYEIALISDFIISADENKVGFHRDYLPVLGSSISGHQFQDLTVRRVEESKNVDKVFPRENLLGDAHNFLLNASLAHLMYKRNLRLSDLGRAIDFEHVRLLRRANINALRTETVNANRKGE